MRRGPGSCVPSVTGAGDRAVRFVWGKGIEPSPGRRQDIEDQMHPGLFGGVVCPVPLLVVERPQFADAHHRRLIPDRQRTSPYALQHQVKPVPDAIVRTGIDMGEHLGFRLEGYQRRASERTSEIFRDALAKRERARKFSGRRRYATLVDVVCVLCAGRQRLSGRPQEYVLRIALAADVSLAAGIREPDSRHRIQFRQHRAYVQVFCDFDKVQH